MITGNELRGIVREVREYITEHGWCQGTYINGDGAVCIWGAYDRVNQAGNIGSELAFRLAITADLPATGDPAERIVIFNDDPRTTIEDVLLHLKQVEARLEVGS